MSFIVSFCRRIWDKLIILSGVFLILVPLDPANMPLSGRDSGVFLYIGWRILNGEIPYQDIWDHKPPIIFYLNALGLALTNGSRWGVWLIEAVCLFGAAYLGYKLVRKSFGILPAMASLFLWLMNLVFLLQGGNLTTEYVLPMQFLCFWLVYDADKKNYCSWRGFLIGLLCGAMFLTKQNTIGIGIALILYLTINRMRSNQFVKLFRELLTILAGALLVLIPSIAYFAAHGAILQFWDAAFVYNLAYSSGNLQAKIQSIINGIYSLSRTGLIEIAFIGYLTGLGGVIFKKNLKQDWLSLLLIGFIDFPIELIFVGISGRSYPHYYISMLPVLCIFTGFAIWMLINYLSGLGISKKSTTAFMLVTLLMLFLVLEPSYFVNLMAVYKQADNNAIISYIEHTTSPEDMVLLWGAETGVNFYATRRSPTRFVYQFPLYQQGYSDEKIVAEFIDDIIRNKPRLIIDTMELPFLDFPIKSDRIQTGIIYLHSHYYKINTIGSWTVYQYKK